MSQLKPMPDIAIPSAVLRDWGATWQGRTGSDGKPRKPCQFDRKQGMDFGKLFDDAFGKALAEMLGGIPIRTPAGRSLTPPDNNCVEVGTTRVIGGIRPQNYDVAYRPDGPRVVFDSKTLNERQSIGKNWQNMINDLATEAATAHIRFPYCVVAFLVVMPLPAFQESRRRAIISTLERLGSRRSEMDQHHLAEAVSLVLWDPATGEIDTSLPRADSRIALKGFSDRVYRAYTTRYQHLPPHI